MVVHLFLLLIESAEPWIVHLGVTNIVKSRRLGVHETVFFVTCALEAHVCIHGLDAKRPGVLLT